MQIQVERIYYFTIGYGDIKKSMTGQDQDPLLIPEVLESLATRFRVRFRLGGGVRVGN